MSKNEELKQKLAKLEACREKLKKLVEEAEKLGQVESEIIAKCLGLPIKIPEGFNEMPLGKKEKIMEKAMVEIPCEMSPEERAEWLENFSQFTEAMSKTTEKIDEIETFSSEIEKLTEKLLDL